MRIEQMTIECQTSIDQVFEKSRISIRWVLDKCQTSVGHGEIPKLHNQKNKYKSAEDFLKC